MLLCSCIAEDILRTIRSDEVPLDGAAIVCDKEEFIDANLLKHGKHLLACTLMAVITDLFRGLAVTFQIDGDALILIGDSHHLMVPHEPRVQYAMQEDYRRALPACDIVPVDDVVVARRINKVMSEGYAA